MGPPIDDRRIGESGIRPDSGPVGDPDDIDATAVAFDDVVRKARRLVALELDLADTRRRLAEDNLKITEAQLELAEAEIERLTLENEKLRREIGLVRGES